MAASFSPSARRVDLPEDEIEDAVEPEHEIEDAVEPEDEIEDAVERHARATEDAVEKLLAAGADTEAKKRVRGPPCE